MCPCVSQFVAPVCRHVTFAANVSGQLVATVLAGVLVDKLGRHNIISCSLLLGGVACLACAHATDTTAQIVLATIGQFGCTGDFTILTGIRA